MVLVAISRFIHPVGGLEFVDELLDSGAILTVLEMISLKKTSDEDRIQGVDLLQCISENGIQAKEMLCKSGTIRVICEALAISENTELVEKSRKLLMGISTGNPKYLSHVYRAFIALLPCDSPSAVHLALRMMRTVQEEVEPIKEIAAPLVQYGFGSMHGEIRYEARHLALDLLKTDIASHIYQAIFKALIDCEEWITVNYVRQACAVKMIDEILMTFPEEHLQKALVEKCIIGRLLLTLACVKYKETQKNSALALSTLALRIPSVSPVITSSLGPLADFFPDDAKMIFTKMTEDEADAIRSIGRSMLEDQQL